MPLQVAEKPNPGRRWKLVLRVIAIVVSLSGVGCVAYLLYQLRRWKIDHPDGDYQADEFILAWLVFTVRCIPNPLSSFSFSPYIPHPCLCARSLHCIPFGHDYFSLPTLPEDASPSNLFRS